jgi:hypothetical protein
MPKPGEDRETAADMYAHVFLRVTDLRAGTASESLLYPNAEPWVAHSDIRQARKFASIICTSDASIEALLLLGLEEAKSLVHQHRAAVLAIADALMLHRTLDAAMIDTIIECAVAQKAHDDERARRAGWRLVEQNAADFSAGLET